MSKVYLSPKRKYFNKGFCIMVVAVCCLFILAGNAAQAQLSFTNGSSTALIDFSNTMPTTVGTTPSTAFAGAGFSPNPATAGRLNSNAWAVTGWSDGALAFGGTQAPPPTTDYNRGATAVAVTTGGIYAYTGAGVGASAANPILMMQPGTNDFTPGTLTLKLQNNGVSIINQLAISYKIYQRNDGTRSQSLNLSYSYDDVTYTPFTPYDYSTPGPLTANGFELGANMTGQSITGLNIPATTVFYLKWSSDDVAGVGSGTRDEIGLDDINITANYPGACTPPTINATINSFSAVSGTQMTVNFTRGNGTGGMLAVVSPAALSQNPISGITYTANSNYGTGQALGNGFVVYNSNAPSGSFVITGLSPLTTYRVNLFEYDITVPCYFATATNTTQATGSGSAIPVGSQFRSHASGNWANAATWEYNSGSGWNWPSDRIPTSADGTIAIQATHVVDVSSSVSMDETSIAGTLTISNSGILNLNDGTGTDIDIPNGGNLQFKTTAIYTTAFVRGGAATLNVATGGRITIGNGASTSGYSPLAYQAGLATWNDGAIFDWNTTDPFVTTGGITYFPGAAAGVIPIFRISKSPSLQPGAATNTTWNGLMEVNANLTLKLAGQKIFRNGIIGTAALTQDDACGQFIINGATAKLGIATLNLNTTTALGLDINASVTTMTSASTINSATIGVFTVSAASSLYCDSYIISGTGIFSLASGCTMRLGDPGGISSAGATGNIQTSGARTFNTATNFIYNGTANQVTGNGMPTAITSLNINCGAGKTVTLSTTNTTTGLLTLTTGLYASGSGNTLNISSGGTATSIAGDFATGATAGIINFPGTGTFSGICSPYDVYASGGVNFTGTITIQNGGSFRINAGGFANLNGPFYADGSTLIYNSGGVYGVSNEWVAGATLSTTRGGPSNVTILASGTAFNFGAAGSSRTMRGNLLISSGTTFTLSSAAGGDLLIGGNWTRTGGTFVNSARKVTFNGVAAQTVTVTGGGTETFGYMQVNKTIATSLVLAGAPNATNIQLNGNPLSGAPTNTLEFYSGDIDLNQNTFNFASWNGNQNNIQMDGVTGNFTHNIISTGGQGVFAVFNNNAASHTVIIARFSAASTRRALLVCSSTVKFTTGAAAGGSGGIDFGTNTTFFITTINGTLEIETNGFVSTNPPIYGANSNLVYNTGGTFNRNVEWGSTQTQPGYPYNVTLQNNTTNFYLNNNNNGNNNRFLAGTLTIASGSTFYLNEPGFFYLFPLKIGIDLALNGTLVLPPGSIGADLYIAGNWNRTATGAFTANDRAVFFNGSGASTITANGGQLFPYLYLIMGGAGNSVALVDDISITKEFGITTGTFNLQNKNVTLKSDVNATAAMGKFGASGSVSYGGGAGTGRFIVERYIPTAASVSAPNHTKSWQFLAVPVNVDNQTVNAAWQEGQLPAVVGTAGLGTIISNSVAGTGGFDIVGGAGPSMKTYVPATDSWLGISGTNITHYNQKGYMIFVRGDRSVQTYNNPVVPTTTLRTKGKIMEPNNLPPTTNIGVTQFESVGNPYASAIDISNTAGVVLSANVQKVFYVWDPRLGSPLGYGAYQTLTKGAGADNNYYVTPGGGSYGVSGTMTNTIESGQAFFVHTVGGAGTVSFNENAKISGSRLVTRMANVVNNDKQIRNSLYIISGGNRKLIDGVLNQFDRSYSNGLDILDALKLLNTGENLGIKSGGKLLSVERSGLIRDRDTIHYNLGQLSIQQYQFELTPQNVARQGLKAFLIDKFLGTKTVVSLTDTTRINFNVVNVPGSYAPGRFMLVFIEKNRPFIYSLLNAEHQQDNIIVKWETGETNITGAFDVERSADGVHFTKIHSEPVMPTENYSWTDSNPLSGDNYYRIHNPDPSDKNSYSNKVKVAPAKAGIAAGITIYPNPVKDGIINLRMQGLAQGNYLLKLYNNSGQQVVVKDLQYDGAADNEAIKLPANISKGIYKLEITYPGGTRQSEQVFIIN